MSNITSTTTGVVLGSVSQNPATIVAGAYVTNTTAVHGYVAVYGSALVAWTLTNLGTVKAGANDTIPGGADGVQISGSASTLTNSGTIIATGSSGIGVYLRAGGTVVDSGTISGGTAISFGGTGGNLLELEAGYKFIGKVTGSTSAGATNTLELAGSVGGPLAVNYAGLTLTNFQDVLFGAGGGDTLKVTNTAGTLPVTISGFTLTTDVVDLTGIGTNGTITSQSATQVTIKGSLGSESLKLDASDATHFTVTSDGATGTDLTLLQQIVGTSFSGEVDLNNPTYYDSAIVTSTGTIIGPVDAVYGGGKPGTLTNYGTITQTVTGGYGVNLGQGGIVTNIAGSAGGGYISGSGAGVTIGSTGTVLNTGTIVGGIGVGAGSGATVTITNAGTITGTGGTAVALAGGADRLIVDPGATFSGMLDGGGGSSVLEIDPSGSDPVYVSLGSVVNFSLLQVDPSATVSATGVLSIPTLVNQGQVNIRSGDQFAFGAVSGDGVIDLGTGGTVTFTGTGTVANQTLFFHPPGGTALIEHAGEFGATVTGFTGVGDTIDLTGIVFSGTTSVGFNASSDLLTVTEGANSATLQLGSASYSGITWVARSDGATGTDITIACFLRGTRILTPEGEVAVEDLAIGDRVVTLSGAVRRIKWIGRRSYDSRFAAGNPAVLPICVEAGALADGVPARDLFVSPEHALLIPGSSPGTGVLVPARLLANGATVRQVESVERLDYFHIELDSHDVIFAEGMPAESYVDCGNRLIFQNAGEFAALYPHDDRPPWQFCATRLDEASPPLIAIRAALLQRAEDLSHRLDPDPDLHLVVDGRTIWPESIAGDRYRFAIPASSASVWLVSRSAVPAEIEAGSRDTRRLGVPVERVALFDAERSVVAWHDDAALGDGFYADEELQRWTDGLARLPESWLRAFPAGAVLEVDLIPTGLCYRVPPPRIAAAA